MQPLPLIFIVEPALISLSAIQFQRNCETFGVIDPKRTEVDQLVYAQFRHYLGHQQLNNRSLGSAAIISASFSSSLSSAGINALTTESIIFSSNTRLMLL